jgi:hypothetical protein
MSTRVDDAMKAGRSDTVTLTNPPIGTVRWNVASAIWEQNTGTVSVPVWSALTTLYNVNVLSATRWTTGRTIGLTGDITGTSAAFDGQAALSFATTLATVNSNVGAFGSSVAIPIVTVNAKGLVTAVSTAALGGMAAQAANAVAITGGAISGTALTLVQSTTAAPTVEGRVEWDTDDNTIKVGDSVGTATFAHIASALTRTNGTYGTGCIWNGNVITVTYGGTGAATFTAGGLLVGNGTGAIGIATGAQIATAISTNAVTNATNATNATHIAGGGAGFIHYQISAGVTGFTAVGTAGQVLTSNAGASAPSWVNQNTLSVSSATTATTATNLAGGVAGGVHYQTGAGLSAITGAGTAGQPLLSGGAGVPTWGATLAVAFGGTGGTSQATAQAALGVPSTTGGGATGTSWAISITGSAASATGNAATATAALGFKTATTTVDIQSATAPVSGQVLVATSGTAATWQTPPSAGVDNTTVTNVRLKGYTEETTSLTVTGTTQNLDLSLANIFLVTLNPTTSCTFTFTNAPSSGIMRAATVILTQGGTGSKLATFTGAVYTDAVAPVLATVAAKRDVLQFFTVDGGTSWLGAHALANL